MTNNTALTARKRDTDRDGLAQLLAGLGVGDGPADPAQRARCGHDVDDHRDGHADARRADPTCQFTFSPGIRRSAARRNCRC